jgi:hypothetical protein
MKNATSSATRRDRFRGYVCFAPEELEAVKVAAARANMTFSRFVRSLSLEGAGVRPLLNEEDRAVFELLIDHMRAISANLNQVSRALHMHRPDRAAEIGVHLRDVRALVVAQSRELDRIRERSAKLRLRGPV